METIEQRIVKVLKEIFPNSASDQFDPQASLLDQVGLDSLNFVRLIVLLEQEFGVSFHDELLIVDHFSTIEKIKNLVESLQFAGR